MSRFRRGKPIGSMRSAVERGDPRKFAPGYGLAYFFTSERGITLATGVVSAWVGLGGAISSVSQSTADRRPLFVADGRLGRPTIQFDGVDDFMVSASATTNQPSRVFLSMKMITAQSSASNHDTVWSRGAAQLLVIDTTPRSILGAGTNLVHNAAIANGTWARVELRLDGVSGEICVNGSAVASGDVGSNSGGILTLGSFNSGTTHATNVEVLELFEITGTLGQSELTRLRNRQKARLGV